MKNAPKSLLPVILVSMKQKLTSPGKAAKQNSEQAAKGLEEKMNDAKDERLHCCGSSFSVV